MLPLLHLQMKKPKPKVKGISLKSAEEVTVICVKRSKDRLNRIRKDDSRINAVLSSDILERRMRESYCLVKNSQNEASNVQYSNKRQSRAGTQ